MKSYGIFLNISNFWTFLDYVSVEKYLCIGYNMPYLCYSWIYKLVLNISCQHLGDECNLEGFLVPHSPVRRWTARRSQKSSGQVVGVSALSQGRQQALQRFHLRQERVPAPASLSRRAADHVLRRCPWSWSEAPARPNQQLWIRLFGGQVVQSAVATEEQEALRREVPASPQLSSAAAAPK